MNEQERRDRESAERNAIMMADAADYLRTDQLSDEYIAQTVAHEGKTRMQAIRDCQDMAAEFARQAQS